VSGARAQHETEAEPGAPLPAAVPREIDRAVIDAALARVSRHEPPVGAVVGAALRASGADPDEISGMVTRARVAGLVPVLRAGGRRGRGQDLSELQPVDGGGRATWSSDDQYAVYGTLIFRFDRLLFAREEVPLLREARARRAERWELVRTVVHVYYERRRLMLESALLPPDVERAVRTEELGALLDGFTGGEFSRMIRRSP
jgi:hypothetical protein